MTRLSDLFRCFQGVVPSLIATSDRNGIPNITYVSQVYYVDEQHVALSRQFFSKTSRNLEQNPRASVEIYDPVTLQPYRLRLRFLRSETSGALFDTMAMRIRAIASHTGMEGVFRLIASDVFAVENVECVENALSEQSQAEEAVSPIDGLRSEMRGLQWISESINRAKDLESLLDGVLDALEVYFGFLHSMVLLQDETLGKLVAVASRGFGESGVGAEVAIGQGMIGTAARERRILRMTGLDASFRYSRAVRKQMENSGSAVNPEIPLPGYPDAQSAIVMPLVLGDQLIGVIAAQSRDPVRFDEWDETYLSVIGNQIALGIDRMMLDDREDAPATAPQPATPRVVAPPPAARVRHAFVYYRSDDAVFVDNDYLIRNVPARILWKLLGEWKQRGRTEFSNRELRLDPGLGLPEIKDNLESRLILLRRRLEEKATGVRIVSAGRGRFTLVIDAELELSEK